jgi:hypothetical protein
MTTKKQLTDKIAELQAQVDAMPDEPSDYWKPVLEDEYWFVTFNNNTNSQLWQCASIDLYRLSQGNVFRTIAEAKHHKKKLEVIGKIRLAAMNDIAENDELDWGGDECKYYIEYYNVNKKWSVETCIAYQNPLTIYFKTNKAAEKCLADLGDELDILIGEEK